MHGEWGCATALLPQAAELGQWGIARRVFEHATQRHPRHPLMLEKLVEVRASCEPSTVVHVLLVHASSIALPCKSAVHAYEFS